MGAEIKVSQADAFTHALAGAAGGAMSMALTYPLVAVTTKLQTQGSNESHESKKLKKKLSLAETAKEVYQEQGVYGFFAGLESAILGMTLSTFVYYYCYEASSRCLLSAKGKQRLNTAESMLVGSIAGSVNAATSNPLWVANTRMTVNASKRGTLGTILDIARNEGPASLFNGLKPALVLVINPIIQYTVFEQLKNRVLESNQKSTLGPSWAFALGAIGKLVATGSTYPYVTMKARMHLQNNENKSSTEKSLIQLMINTVKKNGVSELYRGMGIKLIQSVLTAAFLFFFKEGLVIWSLKLVRLLSQVRRRRTRILNRA
ncbi:LANO_0H21726g1_1 [Lachancea nothofagi CBS 11611]|uniref:LANO_0H21726g1_1 n=1 Tax=Lachancea nothofagi CBS 11611 TaxID=1266666 RepID=A0A1G4KNI8_9SACH|nr:LANO_0H21726g1_1 [Lachancea nothofagi CBS 11611]